MIRIVLLTYPVVGLTTILLNFAQESAAQGIEWQLDAEFKRKSVVSTTIEYSLEETVRWEDQVVQLGRIECTGSTALLIPSDRMNSTWSRCQSIDYIDLQSRSLQTLYTRGPVRDAACTQDGTFVVANGDDVQLWNPNGEVLREWHEFGRCISQVEVSNGHLYLAENNRFCRSNTVFIRSFSSKEPRVSLQHETFTGDVRAGLRLHLSSDGKWLATCGEDGMRVWNVLDMKSALDIPGRVSDVCFSESQELVAIALKPAPTEVLLISLTSTEVLARAKVDGNPYLNQITFSPTGKLLVSAAREVKRSGEIEKAPRVLFWNAKSLAPAGSLPKNAGDAAAFTADGESLITGGGKGKALVWRAKSLQ